MKPTLPIRDYVLILSLLPALLIAALETYFVSHRFDAIDNELLERGRLMSSQMAASAEYGVFSNNRDFLIGIASAAVNQNDVSTVSITNASGEILAHAGRPEIAGSLRIDNTKHENFIVIVKPIIPAPIALNPLFEPAFSNTPIGKVRLTISRVRTNQLKNQLLTTSLLVALTLFATSALLMYAFMRVISRPISALGNVVTAIGEGRLDSRFVGKEASITELEELSIGINSMAEKLQQERTTLQNRIEEATEALRLQKEAAELVGQTKSHLLALASHDLRQPMQALVFYLHQLGHRISEGEQVDLLGKLESSVEALTQLLNSLMDISRLDAGVVETDVKVCAIDTILERVRASFANKSAGKNLRFVVHPCKTSWRIVTDPILLERVLMNLTGNAVRYTQNNGTILIACRQRADHLRIEIRDNGPGIATDQIDKIFTEFFRGEQHTKTGGLGLGLSIVKKLCDLLGHNLMASSQLSRGSIFSVEVKLANGGEEFSLLAESNDADLQSGEDQALKKCKILLVDDDPAVLSSLHLMLETWGCDVSAHGSFQSLSAQLESGNAIRPTVVLSDYHLEQDKNGIELMGMVRKTFGGPRIPGIIITADISGELKQIASELKVVLAQKPIRPARLKSLLTYCLNERI